MTLLHDAVDAKKLDTRVVERNVLRGTVSPTEVDKATKQLPDDAANADYTSIEDLANDGKSE
jgi:hypothetical protein